MSNKDKGVYQKFTVTRNDGKSEEGEKHHSCRYFVIDLDHDRHARPALNAYADCCAEQYPALAKDLRIISGALGGEVPTREEILDKIDGRPPNERN